MKKLLFVIALLAGYAASAQLPLGLPQRFAYKWYQYTQYASADSGLATSVRDTTWRPNRAGWTTYFGNNLYHHNGSRWVYNVNNLDTNWIKIANNTYFNSTMDNRYLQINNINWDSIVNGSFTGLDSFVRNQHYYTQPATFKINGGITGSLLQFDGHRLILKNQYNSVYIGEEAGSFNTGLNNFGWGTGALYAAAGSDNIGMGINAGFTYVGSRSIFLGHRSGFTTDSNDIVAIGYTAALHSNSKESVFIGSGTSSGTVLATATLPVTNFQLNSNKIGGLTSFISAAGLTIGYAGAFQISFLGSYPSISGVQLSSDLIFKGSVSHADTITLYQSGQFTNKGTGNFTIYAHGTTSNIVAIGHNANADANNQVSLGNNSVTQLKANKVRIKTDVTPTNGQILVHNGTQFIPANPSFVSSESDPIANAKTVTLNAGLGISITGTPTQALSSNPSWTIASSGDMVRFGVEDDTATQNRIFNIGNYQFKIRGTRGTGTDTAYSELELNKRIIEIDGIDTFNRYNVYLKNKSATDSATFEMDAEYGHIASRIRNNFQTIGIANNYNYAASANSMQAGGLSSNSTLVNINTAVGRLASFSASVGKGAHVTVNNNTAGADNNKLMMGSTDSLYVMSPIPQFTGATQGNRLVVISSTGFLKTVNDLPVHADNTAATSAGLFVGEPYRTSTGVLMIRY